MSVKCSFLESGIEPLAGLLPLAPSAGGQNSPPPAGGHRTLALSWPGRLGLRPQACLHSCGLLLGDPLQGSQQFSLPQLSFLPLFLQLPYYGRSFLSSFLSLNFPKNYIHLFILALRILDFLSWSSHSWVGFSVGQYYRPSIVCT